MEIMYSNNYNEIIKKNSFCGIYGDKLDLINSGLSICGIDYDDEWTVKRFLNGLKFKISDSILNLFNELEINYNILNKKIKNLSKSEFKLILLVYILLNKKEIVILDYFDKGLSYKVKKRVINYLKSKYEGTLVVISNDLVFLNLLCNNLIVFDNSNIVFNDKIEYIYKSRIKVDYPEIIKFIRIANKKKAKLSYTVEVHELLKDIYRSVR
ncbi:MAG: hypothetical protein IJD92_04825 [Bacilli bacterium]|nr:hypothetical protein [Bacilli bacterium]